MTDQQRIWKIGWVVGVLLVVFLAAVSIKELKSIAYVGKDTPIMNTITVNGKGEAISIPDIATFSFSVSENAKTIDVAQNQAATKINAAIKALKDAGVDEKDIKTTSYTINPHYDYVNGICTAGGMCNPGKSVLNGYDVGQTIQVKIRDLKKAGSIFGIIGSLNVQTVDGLSFSIDDIDKVKADARNLAIADAQAKAKTLAKQLGVTIVSITSFYDQSDQPMYAYAGDAMNMKSAVAPQAAVAQIPQGEQKITSNVSITYQIR